MTLSFWRTTTFVLAAACVVLAWRACGSSRAARRAAADEGAAARATPGADHAPDVPDRHARRPDRSGDSDDDPAPTDGDLSAWGITVPGWLRWFAPQPGEDLLAYRDRMVPIAQAAVAPHRARVARGRDAFAAAAHLDPRQRAELDAAVTDAAAAIQDRVMQGLLSGDLLPARVKPSTAVAFARDVLDLVDRAQRRFTAALRDDQRALLAEHPFDVADYLLFSTRWEDMLGVTE